MALIACSKCSREISHLALACPGCGAPQPPAVVAPAVPVETFPAEQGNIGSTSPVGLVALGFGLAAAVLSTTAPYMVAVMLSLAAIVCGILVISVRQAVIGIFSMVLGIGGAGMLVWEFGMPGPVRPIVLVARVVVPATLSQFDRLRVGIAPQEAAKIFGTPGKHVASVGAQSVDMRTYQWANTDGSNATATFQNDRLVAKAQFGLR